MSRFRWVLLVPLVAGLSVLPAAAGHAAGAPPAKARAERLLAMVHRPGGLARFGLPQGKLVAATACVRGTCVSRQWHGGPRTICRNGVCLAPAEAAVARPGDVQITVWLE
jgi:hypothetical protein